MYEHPLSPALLAHIAEAHRLGLHEDHVFHAECVMCFTTACDAYKTECHEILAGLQETARIAAFDAFVDTLTTMHNWSLLHDDTVYTVASFLGLPCGGTVGWEADPRWGALHAVATPIRQRRLAQCLLWPCR